MVLFQKGHLFDIMAKGVGTKLWKGAYKGGALIWWNMMFFLT